MASQARRLPPSADLGSTLGRPCWAIGARVDRVDGHRGASKTLTLHLAAGTDTYFCTVPGHRQAGMQGTLTVSRAWAAGGVGGARDVTAGAARRN